MRFRKQQSKLIHVVLGIVVRGRRVLVKWREESLHQGGCWEFPGGKIELGETPKQALQRELLEELGVAGTVGKSIIRFAYDYDDRALLLDVYKVQIDRLSRIERHRDAIRWRTVHDLHANEFPPANRSILNALKLPELYAITSAQLLTAARAGTSGFKTYFSNLRQTGVNLVLLRAKGLGVDEYRRLARRAIACAKQEGLRPLLHDLPEEVENLDAAGVHLSQDSFSRVRNIRDAIPSQAWLAVSCHDSGEMFAAEEAGADFCVLGPVGVTRGHAASLGFAAFKELVERARVPVYALGGMSCDDLQQARDCGAQGIAGIRCFDSC